ncbi:prefoldin subunit alpha [Candidatus Pacearchaeota archaeon]|nr:prefoldin subunit alpha [Candidatus Pacearchaeota archaeon]
MKLKEKKQPDKDSRLVDEQVSKELMFKFAIFEQQIQQIQEQNGAIEKALADSKALLEGLENLKGSNGKEVFASIGKGIFLKAKIISEDLIVDIGGKNFVRKNLDETQKIIGSQIKKLEEARAQLQENLEKINEDVENLIKKSQEK